MKNIRLLVSGLCLFLATGLGLNQAAAQTGRTPAPAGATIKMQIERKEITKEQAEEYRLNGTTISLGINMIFSKEWEYTLQNVGVSFLISQVAWAFYETEAYSDVLNSLDPSHYLQNPSDYLKICAATTTPGKPSDACTLPLFFPSSWYIQSFTWDNWGWPSYAWGASISNGSPINIANTYCEKLADGTYKVKLYDIQFQLNPSNTNFRSLPVGFLDNILGDDRIDASTSNNQINLALGNDRFWPSANGSTYETCPATSAFCQDWTDFAGSKYFEFIPGGLFIQNGPDVETFEPSFLS